MSRLMTSLTCSLLLAWTAYPAGSGAAQEADNLQEREETQTNTQRGAVDQLPDQQMRQPRLRQQQNRAQDDSRQFNQQPSDRTVRDRQLDQQFDRGRRPQLDERADQRFEAEGRFETEGRARQRPEASMQRQRPEEAGQQFDLGAELSASEDALRVTGVNQGTLAAEIGLWANDEIVSVGGRTVTSADQLNDVLVRSQPFQERVPIVVRRAGSPTTLYLSPQLLPGPAFVPARRVDPGLGVVLVPSRGDRLIVREASGGLADIIGLRERDVIVSVAGRPVTSQEQFADLLYSTDAEQIPIVIIRDGRREALFVRQEALGFRMHDDADLYLAQEAWLGVVLDTRYQDAAVVRRVVPDSPADDAGVREDDSIDRVNGGRVTSPDHLTWLIDSLEPGQQVELDVSRRISGTLVARLEGQDAHQPRQAVRPTYELYEPGDVPVRQRQFYRGEIVDDFDADPDRAVIRDRFGPAERGLRDRLDRDEIPDEPRGILRRW